MWDVLVITACTWRHDDTIASRTSRSKSRDVEVWHGIYAELHRHMAKGALCSKTHVKERDHRLLGAPSCELRVRNVRH